MPPCRILLAEDDDHMRRLMSVALRSDGYVVVEVSNGEAFLEAARRFHEERDPPALVVSDIRMPGMSGLEVVRRLRAWGWTVPIVLVTAFGDDDTLDAASRDGATAVFSKPFDLDDLRTAAVHFLAAGVRPA